MDAQAVLRYARMAPRKARVVADLIRGKPVDEAVNILMYTNRGASSVLRKLLVSALSNADEQSGGNVDPERMVVGEITVDQGPTLKRWRPRAMGRATRIEKKTSHIRIVLRETD